MTHTTHPAHDTTHDMPAHQVALAMLLRHQLAAGVPHGDLMDSLLAAVEAFAHVYPCCAQVAGRSALLLGGRLLAATQLAEPSHTTTPHVH